MTNAKTHTQKLNKFPLAYSLYLWSVPAVRTVCLLFLSGPAGQKYQSCRCCCRSLRRGCRPTNRTKNRFSQIKDDNYNRHFTAFSYFYLSASALFICPISVCLTSLTTMLQIELPHINLLSKVRIVMYGYKFFSSKEVH